jgi:hypothetical protein
MLETHPASVPRSDGRELSEVALSMAARPVRFPLVVRNRVRDNEHMTTKTFLLAGIDPAEADRLRAAGGVTYVADSKPGYPCRQCLRDAEIGDEMLLVSYDPFTASSPYRCASPIFIHNTPCAPEDQEGLPVQLTGRTLSVRGFDEAAMMLDAALIDGTDLSTTIEALFENPAIDHLHIHNASRGCWAASVNRGPDISPNKR